MLERIRSHVNVIHHGKPLLHYKFALHRRMLDLRLRFSKNQQLIFNLYKNTNAILKRNDSLALWAYFYGLDSAIVKTLENYLKPGMIIADVGANAGLYTLICASLVGETGKVYAFEPVPWLVQRLEENARLNSMTNIGTYNVALGIKAAKSHLYLPRSGSEWSSLYQWKLTCNKYIEVSIITLDEWIQKYCIKNIDLLKVDAEGSELDIFLGGERSLRGGIIKAIIVEFNKETQKAAGFSSDDLRLLLERYGFEWYKLPYDVRNYTQVDWSSLADLSNLIGIKRNL